MYKYCLNACISILFIVGISQILSGQYAVRTHLQEAIRKHDVSQFSIFDEVINPTEKSALGLKTLGEASYFKVNESNINQILNIKPDVISFGISTPEGNTLTMVLYKKNPISQGFKVSSPDSQVYTANGVWYRGILQEDPNSLVAISIYQDEIAGVIASPLYGQFDIGKVKNKEAHVIFSASTLNLPAFECHTSEFNLEGSLPDGFTADRRDVGDCVQFFIDADYELFQEMGGMNGTVNFVTGFFNVVAAIYENETLDIAISELFVWSTPDNFPTDDAGDALDFYQNFRTNFDGDLAHLVSYGGQWLGGLAWVDVLCDSDYAYAFSGIDPEYEDLPQYSWTVGVFAHEAGHNVGSPHTHNCSWPGGAIDNCEDTEGGCPPGPPPTNGGTVMSYCHLTGSGINFANGFGPLPGNLIRSKVANANCLVQCSGGGGCPTFDSSIDGQHPRCAGEASGSVTISAPTNGTSPYTYLWNNGATTQNLVNVPAGTYTVTITDAESCTGILTFALFDPTVVTLTVTGSNVTCFGYNNGAAEAQAFGGSPPYLYVWQNGSTQPFISNLAPGTYAISVVDFFSCQTSGSVTITEPSQILPNASATDVTIPNGNNGTATASPSGGVPGYTYLWSTGATTKTINNLAPGNYTVTVTDANQCTATQTVTVNDIACPITETESTLHVRCHGGADGSASLTTSNTTGTVSFLWSNGATTSTISNLPAGTYSYTITDAECSKTGSVTIAQPDEIVLNITSLPTQCLGSDGSASVTPTGGVSPFTYSWVNGANTSIISGLSIGAYNVTVTDANFCTEVGTATVMSNDLQPPQLIGTEITFYLGQNGEITNFEDLQALFTDNCGDFSIQHPFNEDSYCSLVGTNFTSDFIVTDLSGNVAIYTFPVHFADLLPPKADCLEMITGYACSPVNYLTDLNLTDNCSDINVNVVTGMPDGSIFTEGTHDIQLEFTDESGNLTTCGFTLQVLPGHQLFEIVRQVSCNSQQDGSIILETGGVAQPFTFEWSDGAQEINRNNLPAGKYTLTLTDNNQCQTIRTYEITEPELLNIVNVQVTNASSEDVADGSISIEIEGGTEPYTITWLIDNEVIGSGTNLQNLLAGDYAVVITDANGCVLENQVIKVSIGLSVITSDALSGMKLFPNPASDFIYLSHSYLNFDRATFEITDLNGRILMTFTDSFDKLKLINISSLQSGVDIFRFMHGQETFTALFGTF